MELDLLDFVEQYRHLAKQAAMPLTNRQEDLLIAVALTEFLVHYEQADPKLAEQA